jgi:AraC-like DNA-binding protein
MIRVNQGMVEIEELSSLACLSRKQFERIFLEYIGISPKQYLKIIRFQSSIFLKSKNEDISLTELAYESGYYDQSHFINEYRKMTGITPKQFFLDCQTIHSDFFE